MNNTRANKSSLVGAVRDTAGDMFLGTLTTALAAVILGFDVVPFIAGKLSDIFSGDVEHDKHHIHMPSSERRRKGIVVTAHGTTQHAGSFHKLAEHLTESGYVVVSVDLCGHGRRFHSARDREVDYERSVRELVRTFRVLRKTFHELPLFCIGESVGAAVAAKAVGNSPGLVNGMVLCSSGIRPALFDPLLTVPDFVKGVFRLNTQMDLSRYISRYSSDDHRVSNEMVSDPLSRVTMTPRELVRTAWFLGQTASAARKIDPSVPVLVVQGSNDGIVAKHGIKDILRNLRSQKKEVVVLPGAGHVLMGTSFIKPAVVESLTRWLDSHVPSKTVFETA